MSTGHIVLRGCLTVAVILLGLVGCGSGKQEAVIVRTSPIPAPGHVAPVSPRLPAPSAFQPGVPPAPNTFSSQPGVLHHTNAPLLPPSVLTTISAKLIGCSEPPYSHTALSPQTASGGVCTSFKSVVYDRTDTARAENPTWEIPPSNAADRQVAFVTIFGHITFYPKTISAAGSGGVWADHYNVEIDPTTGAVLGNGTAGKPLPWLHSTHDGQGSP